MIDGKLMVKLPAIGPQYRPFNCSQTDEEVCQKCGQCKESNVVVLCGYHGALSIAPGWDLGGMEVWSGFFY